MCLEFLGKKLRTHHDSVQQIAQVVGDHAEEIVPGGQCVIGAGALSEQILVGGITLQREKARQHAGPCRALTAQGFIRRSPFVTQRCVFDLPIFSDCGLKGVRCCGVCHFVRLFASPDQHSVGVIPGMFKNSVSMPFCGNQVCSHLPISFFTLLAQTVVSQFALGRFLWICS